MIIWIVISISCCSFTNLFALSFLAYESSCFSGSYVTGEKIDDNYFTKLHALRNDDAQLKRRSESGSLGAGSHNGCEK